MNSPYPDNMGPEEWMPGVDPLILPFTFKIMDIAHASYARDGDYFHRSNDQQFGEHEKRSFHRALRRVYLSGGWQGVTNAVDAVHAAVTLSDRKVDREDRSQFIMWILLRCLDP